MTYSYRCVNGHLTEVQVRIGEQNAQEQCSTCYSVAERDFHTDFCGVTIAVVDPFRSYHLSTKKIVAEGTQQRLIDAPTDNFERRMLEKAHGRTYVGDDTSGFSKNALAGIEMYQAKKAAGEIA